MTVMTYKRATGILKEAGFKTQKHDNTYWVSNEKGTLGLVYMKIPYQMSTERYDFDDLTENEQFLIANTLRKLMMTKLDQREEEQLYYVQFVEGDVNSYLNENYAGELIATTKYQYDNCKTKFTKAEIMAINPNYMLFAVPVEDNHD